MRRQKPRAHRGANSQWRQRRGQADFIADLEIMNLLAERGCGIMEALQLARTGWVVWVQQRGNHLRLRKQLMEQLESLCVQCSGQEGHARCIAAGMVEAGHKADANWVGARHEHNWNRRGCRFCRNRWGSISDYDGHPPLYEPSKLAALRHGRRASGIQPPHSAPR